MPSTTPPGSSQKPQSFLQHPFSHTFPSSFKETAFLRTAGKGEHRRCPACTSPLASGNSGSGPRLGFPHLCEPREKLAGVFLPVVRGLGAGLRVWARGRASQCREQLRPAEHRRRVPRGPAARAASEGGRWRQSSHHFPVSEQIYEPPKSSPAALQEGWGWGLAGGLFAGNCESTFLHGCVPLCNGNPLSRVKRRPSYHDLLCRFPWIPCTINKKRNFKPVFNPA